MPIKHVNLYLKNAWVLELVVFLYAILLIILYILHTDEVEFIITGSILVILPVKYIYYGVNRSKVQWHRFEEKLEFMHEILEKLDPEGEDLRHLNYRDLSHTVVEVNRDNNWVHLPSIVLVAGDLVRIRPGKHLPCEAVGLSGHYINRRLPAYTPMTPLDSPDPLIAKQRVLFRVTSTPAETTLQEYLSKRSKRQKRPNTFYQLSLRVSKVVITTYIGIQLILVVGFAVLWASISDRSWYLFVADPAFLTLAVIPMVIPSLVKIMTCLGNALLWCISEELDNKKPYINRLLEENDKLASLFRIPSNHTESNKMFDMAQVAEKAEEDFDVKEMVKMFSQLSIKDFFKKFRAFLLGGIQRDFNILDLLSSTTYLAFIDKEGIVSEHSKYIDEVMVMGPNDQLVALDLMHKAPTDILAGQTDHDQLAFVEGKWVEHIDSLKPLALAASVARKPTPEDNMDVLVYLNEDHSNFQNTGELFFLLDKEENEIFQDCMCVLAKLLTFTEKALSQHKHSCTLWGTWKPTNVQSLHELSYKSIRTLKRRERIRAAVNDTIDKQITVQSKTDEIQAKMSRPCHLLSCLFEKDGQFEVMSQGNPRVILQNCTDYWDGTNIVMLAEEDRQRINTLLLQWTADDYDSIAFSYKPLIKEEIESILKEPNSLIDLDERTKDLLHSVQRRHIFLGMVAVANHPKPEANHFIEDVFDAGIRFVIFSQGNYLETKAFGDDLGLDTTWNSCISLSKQIARQHINIVGATILPTGIDQVKQHLESGIDTVPLQVSMFSDAAKSDMLEMVQIYQHYGEVVTVVGGCLNSENLAIYEAADVSIGITAQPCGFCSTCNGLRLYYGHNPCILETVGQKIISLPCTFTLGPQSPLYVILQVVKEARKFMTNILNGLLYSASCYIAWCFAAFINLALGLPPFLSPVQFLYIALVVIPSISFSFLVQTAEPNLMKKLTIKTQYFRLSENTWFFWNHITRIVILSVLLIGFNFWQYYMILGNSSMFFNRWVDYSETKVDTAQLLEFFFGTLWTVVFSIGYIHGSNSIFKIDRFGNNLWILVMGLCMVVCVIIMIIYIVVEGVFDRFCELIKEAWIIYLTAFIAIFFIVLVHEVLNWKQLKSLILIQRTLGLYFKTKLGMHSPK